MPDPTLIQKMLGFLGGGQGNNAVAGTAQANSSATALGMKNSITGSLLSGFSGVLNAFDIKNSNMSGNQKKMAQADNGVNMAADAISMIPGVGSLVGTGIKALNALGGSFISTPGSFNRFAINDDLAQSSAFTGTLSGAQGVESDVSAYKSSGIAGKLFGKKDISSDLKASNKQQKTSSNIIGQNQKAKAQMGSADLFSNRTMMNQNGIDYTAIKFGQAGMKINKDIKKLLVNTFEHGGVVQKNIIVNGALHARKHNLKDVKEFKDAFITHKGVPVITKSEGGEIKQHAEVEKDEIILHHSLTEKLEELRKLGTEDAIIEAGKILSKELVKNTKDSKSKLLK